MAKQLKNLTEPEVEEYMQLLGAATESITKPAGALYCLLLFEDMGKPGVGRFVSNCNREDLIEALREFLTILENKEDH